MTNSAVLDLLIEAKEKGISLFLKDEKLRYTIAKNKPLDKDYLSHLKNYKTEIIAFLSSEHGDFKTVATADKAIATFDRNEVAKIPLSFSQERLWFIDQLEGSIPYHISNTLRLKGALDKDIMEQALAVLIDRHEVLRTVIHEEEGIPYQVPQSSEQWKLEYSEGVVFTDEAYLQHFIASELKRPFDLAKDYMFRAHLIKCEEDHHILVLLMHHIAADGWSLSVLVNDLVAFYQAKQEERQPNLPALPIQFADYAYWQRTEVSDEVFKVKMDWWKQQLSGVPPLELPTDFRRPAQQSTKGNSLPFSFGKELSDQLIQLAKEQEATLFMCLLTAFKILLFQYSRQEDICVGTPIANRNRKEVEPLVGFFINTLALRSDLSGDPDFVSLLQQVKSKTLSAYSNQEIPFGQIVEQVEPKRDRSRSPLFQVMFVLLNTPNIPSLVLGQLEIEPGPTAYISAQYDLTFNLIEQPTGIRLGIEYCTDLYQEATIHRLAAHFKMLLKAIIAQPHQKISRLRMLTEQEEQQLLYDFNSDESVYPTDQTILDLFSGQVTQRPAATAVVFQKQTLSYQQLEEQSNQLAHYLLQQSFKQESLIAICLSPSLDMLIAILAVLKTGAAYVPIDPEFPQERIDFLLSDTNATIVLVSSNISASIPKNPGLQIILLDKEETAITQQVTSAPKSSLSADHLAYVIYTSGSTGLPKGVMISHRSLANRLLSEADLLKLDHKVKACLLTNFTFDVSLLEFFLPLIKGGSLLIPSPDMIYDPVSLLQLMGEAGITSIQGTPTYISSLFNGMTVQQANALKLRQISIGGESLSKAIVEKIRKKLPQVKINNHYGPTEVTIDALVLEGVEAFDMNIIGRPLAHTDVYVVNTNDELVPIGVVGELLIGGVGVARGYLNRPELTAEVFVKHLFQPQSGSLLYRTGDLVRWLPDGNLLFVGRKDNQIKLRGYRIELGEIETVLKKQESVNDCVVVVKSTTNDNQQLIAYVVPKGQLDKEQLSIELSAQLPAYMIPAIWVALDVIPLTSSGKINKRALPDPIPSQQEYLAPRTALEQMLVQIWEDILEVKPIGIMDDFFSLGGQSLIAMRVIAAIRMELKKEIPVKLLFSHTTIKQLASYLEEDNIESKLPALIPQERGESIPLSFSQERLWFIDQLEGSTHYHMPSVLRLKGVLDNAALEYALRMIVNRHEVLRTVIVETDGRPQQQILPEDQWKLDFILLADAEDQAALTATIVTLIDQAFDLSKDHTLRGHLIRLSEEEHLLVVVEHHIASDGWSTSILVKELAELYAARVEHRPAELQALPIQYADYAIWQRKYFSGNLLERQLEWWEKQLGGVQPLRLPTDFPRPPIQSNRGGSFTIEIDPQITTQLKELSLHNGASLFMSLLTVFKILLYRYSGQEDICVGTPQANRSYKELEPLVGFFISTLAFRSDLSGNPSFKDLLAQVKQTTLSAFAHQDVPFEQIVEKIESERDPSRSPIFQAMFVLQNLPDLPSLDLGDLEISTAPAKIHSTLYDLTFTAIERAGVLKVIVEYCSDLFQAKTIQGMAAHYQQLLKAVVANPAQGIAQYQFLSATERQQLLIGFNSTTSDYAKEETVVSLFQQQVIIRADANAVVFEGASLSYRELDKRSNQLAHYLMSKGAGPGQIIAICIDRSLDMILGLLAILKTGSAYVPIDPEYPIHRINYILEDTAASLLISQQQISKELDFKEGTELVLLDKEWPLIQESNIQPPSINCTTESLAYIIYTSGSTGQPKGVMITHHNLSMRLQGEIQLLNLDHQLKTVLLTNYIFDVSLLELFLPLVCGGSLAIPNKATLLEPKKLLDLLAIEKVNLLQGTPTYMTSLFDELEQEQAADLSLTKICVGGESLNASLVKVIKEKLPAVQLNNHYGPTETTIDALALEDISSFDRNLIGRPIPNTSIYIVDRQLQLVPVGVIGELLIGGPGVAKGYLNRPELTAATFIPSLFPKTSSEKLYKSGDLAWWLPDGNIEFLGRTDEQVKIRGYRIELGEIEQVIMQIAGISQCSVIAQGSTEKRLIAYVVAEVNYNTEGVLGQLKTQLPDYMIPSLMIELDALPLSATGKVDKKALPDADLSAISSKEYIAPKTAVEQQLAEIWKELLGVEKVGRYDNFFELGGHSLLAMRVIAAVRKTFDLEVEVKIMFSHPTISQMSTWLEGQERGLTLPAIVEQERGEKIPLSFSQERLWFIHQLGGSLHYHMPTVLRLSGALNVEMLQQALASMVNRHEVLRTTLREIDGQAWQVILDKDLWNCGFTTLSSEEFLSERIEAEINQPFDLSTDHLLRAHLFRLTEEEHVLVITIHHIAFDGWSFSVFVNEFVEFYNAQNENRSPVLPDLAIQYADYAIWQRKYLDGEVLEKKMAYWQEKLQGLEPLNLMTDLPRPATQSTRGGFLTTQLNKVDCDEINKLAKREGVTLFMCLLAALKAMLFRYSGQEDICVGSPIANRAQVELEPLVGFFVNTLALRSDLSGNPRYIDLLTQLKATTLEAYGHQDVPFEKIVEAVEVNRDRSRSPIFQVLFVLHNTPDIPSFKLGDISMAGEPSDFTTAKFDLTFSMNETPAGLSVGIEYCSDLFLPATIERMLLHYKNILRSILQNPLEKIGSLKMLSIEEEKQLLFGLNDTTVAYPKAETISDLFEQQVEKTPDETAFVFENQRYTYTELNALSNQMARFVEAQAEVKKGDSVAVMMERSEWYAIAMLGVIKLGATYVPLDIAFPESKLQHIVSDSQVSVLLTDGESKKAASLGRCLSIEGGEALAAYDSSNLQLSIEGTALSYVIYTSGSTGQPKGVEQTQLMLYNLVKWDMEASGMRSGQRHLQFSSFSFDSSLHDIYYALSTGGTIYLLGEELRRDLWQVKNYILEHGIATVSMPYSALKPLFDEIELEAFEGHQIEEVISTGEQLYINGGLRTFLEHYPEVRIFNLYGPSETHVVTGSHYSFSEGEVPVKASIGKAVYNTTLYIFDKNLQLIPEGLKGEIYIGGYNLARGYRGNQAMTEEKFIRNPYNSEELLYRSGDWGRWEADGSIDYLGRLDDQVKIRGYRIELGEVETVLQECSLVNQCVVLAKEDAAGNKRLVAYLVAEGIYDKEAIQEHLKNHLPDYMVPALIMELPEMPLTTNGKVDKRALPNPDASALISNAYVAPTTATEQCLAEIWKDLLNLERVGVHDNFFELGGHSLMAMRVVSAIRKELELEVAVSTLFIHTTISGLASELDGMEAHSALPPILPQERPVLIPLSFAQERLWFIDQLEGSVHYHIPHVLRLKGALNKELLESALQTIVERHEVLRTVFKDIDGQAWQEVMESKLWSLHYIEGPIAEDDKQRSALIKTEINRSFDLSKDYALRVQLYRLAEEEYILVLVIHHIASDGWSMSIFVNELMELYGSKVEGRSTDLPALPVQYADYSFWQRQHLDGELLVLKLQYWETKLSGLEALNLPLDFTRPAVQSTKGGFCGAKLDVQISDQLQQLANQQGITLFMCLLSAIKVLLYRYSGQTDICIGTPIANRTQAAVEPLIGFFLNTLALRSDLSDNPIFTDLLTQVKQTTLDAYTHQDIPFERIVERVEVARDRSRSPLFQVLFIHQNTPDVPELKLGNVDLFSEPAEHNISKYDLSFSVSESSTGLNIILEYCSDLFLPASMERLLEHFLQLLGSIATNPTVRIDQLKILQPKEEQQLLIDFNNTANDYPKDKTLVDLFHEQVKRTPDHIALVFENQELSFRELDRRANQLAHYLQAKGVKEESLVAICIDRSLEMMIGLWGILKAGAAYVPIDPEYPSDRIRYMLEDTEAEVVLSSSQFATLIANDKGMELILLDKDWPLIQQESDTAPSTQLSPNHLAYVIYTSGSTGQPKGVMNQHSGIVNRLLWAQNYYGLKKGNDIVLQKTTFCFDVSVWELFWPMITGVTMVFARPGGHKDSYYLKTLIADRKITTMHFVPSMLEVFLLDIQKGDCANLKRVLCSGEALTPNQVREFKQKLGHAELHNLYGPTEAAIDVTYWPVPAEEVLIDKVPIGKPVANTQLYVLTDSGELALPGAVGELHIGGIQVARGYLNRPKLSAATFIPNPFHSTTDSKLYKTGDLARWLPDGNLEYLGRIDHQVKIRGYRIELGEIEATLQQLPQISQCVVLAREDASGSKRLIAYVVAEEEFNKDACQQYLSKHLPEYMVPALFMPLKELPLTANGKINRKALPNPDASTLLANLFVAPATVLEKQLANIWKTLLEVEKVGLNDNFFELGGHSLLATRVLSAIRKELQVEVSISALFSHPTLKTLSAFIEGQGQQDLMPEIVSRQEITKIPLSFSQERLWFIHQLTGSLHYHMPTVLRLNGTLNVEMLQQALASMVNRHEVLRTTLREIDGQAWQVILDKDLWNCGFTTLSSEEFLSERIEAEINQPFDLSTDHLLRAHLFRLTEEEHVLVITIHHIAFDGWSFSVFVNEFVEFYNAQNENRPPVLPDLVLQYADYAIWQRKYLDGEVLEKKMAYWQEKLQGLEPLNLTTDLPRPAIQSTKGNFHSIQLNRTKCDEIYKLAKREGVTLFMCLLAALKAMLFRYSGQEDICVGSPIANRTQAEWEPLVGFFVNTLALRSDLSDNPRYIDLLAQLKTTTLEAYGHQDVPFEKIVEAVEVNRDRSRSPIFQVLFVLHNNPEIPSFKLGDISMAGEPSDFMTAKFDLTFSMNETPAGLNVGIEYCSDLFLPATIERMLLHYKNILRSILQNPLEKIGSLNMLSIEEEKQLLFGLNDTTVAYPKAETISDLFEQQVEKTPDETAFVFENQYYTYSELNALSNQMARFIEAQAEVKKGDSVAVMMERSEWYAIAMLGIMKLGATYVPLDIAFPESKLQHIVSDSQVSVLLTNGESEKAASLGRCLSIEGGEALAAYDSSNLQLSIEGTALSYVIYTSGSTGQPKGVEQTQLMLYNLVKWDMEASGMRSGQRHLQFSSFSFDSSLHDIYYALSTGGTIYLLGEELRRDLWQVKNYILEHGIATVSMPYSALKPLFDEIELEAFEGHQIEEIISTGEQLYINGGLRTFLEHYPEVRIFNLYGPSETHVVTGSHYSFSEGEVPVKASIGKAVYNTTLYIFDKNLQLIPEGLKGEIYIGGYNLARGYRGNQAMTEEKFIRNPYNPKELLYRSGDWGRWEADGSIDYLGRLDDQVKIRGYRIELGEVETVLQECPLVNQCVVLAKEDAAGNKRLVAYLVAEGVYDKEAIQEHLKNHLPDYMVPALIMELPEMPLTTNGKVDKRALPNPDASALISNVYVAPATITEQRLAEIWKDLLNLEKVGIHDNFFELGGHSLLATRVISTIRKELQIELGIVALFNHPTLKALSAFIEEQGPRTLMSEVLPRKEAAKIPLSFSQERLWFIDRMAGSIQYHMPMLLQLKGVLDLDRLETAFQAIINRHEVLRTTFPEEQGQAWQHIMEKDGWKLDYTELESADETVVTEWINEATYRPFDLAKDHMLRAHVLKQKDDEYLLIFVIHHIASDGWSTPILIGELAELYKAQEEQRLPKLAPLPIQYADYALWQRNWLKDEVLNNKLAYWKKQLIGVEPLSLPTDFPRPKEVTNKGGAVDFVLEKEIKDGLYQLAQQEEATLFMLLLTIFKILLHRYSGQDDICIGTPIANRTQANVEPLIGFFLNTLAIRSDLSEQPNFRSLLVQVKTSTLEAFTHQDIAFERVLEVVQPERHLNRNPLFQVFFNLLNQPQQEEVIEFKELTLESLSETAINSKFDITLYVAESSNGIVGSFVYATDLFNAKRMEEMAIHFRELTKSILADPSLPISQLNFLSAEEQKDQEDQLDDFFTD